MFLNSGSKRVPNRLQAATRGEGGPYLGPLALSPGPILLMNKVHQMFTTPATDCSQLL